MSLTTIMLIAALVGSPEATGQTLQTRVIIEVTTLSDAVAPSGCSLREAVAALDNSVVSVPGGNGCVRNIQLGAGPDMIAFSPSLIPGQIFLNSALEPTQGFTLLGPGRDLLEISGQGQTEILSAFGVAEPFALEGLTITRSGFSLHAGVCAQAFERDKLERLCRYITRPPVADQRISLTPNGNIRYELKTPYRDGTTHVILEPMDFMPQGTFSIAARSHLVARLAALVPRPRVNLTRYHGVFAPSSRLRGQITPARRGKGGRPGTEPTEDHEHEPARPRQAMTWAQRLRRVFNIDIETCDACGGPMKVIASIEDPDVIGKILNHLEKRQTPQQRPPTRGPPCFFD